MNGLLWRRRGDWSCVVRLKGMTYVMPLERRRGSAVVGAPSWERRRGDWSCVCSVLFFVLSCVLSDLVHSSFLSIKKTPLIDQNKLRLFFFLGPIVL